MRKLITNLCTIAITTVSLNTFNAATAIAADLSDSVVEVKASKSADIQSILANLSSSMERGESQRKALVEAALALENSNISSNDLLEFGAAGMTSSEATAYKAKLNAKIAQIKGTNDADELALILQEVSSASASGANFRGCGIQMGAQWVGYITLITLGIMALSQNNESKHADDRIKANNLEIVDLQSEINILIGEGVKPTSFLIASIQADIDYLKEVNSQEAELKADSAEKAKLYGMIAGAGAVVGVLGSITMPRNGCYY